MNGRAFFQKLPKRGKSQQQQQQQQHQEPLPLPYLYGRTLTPTLFVWANPYPYLICMGEHEAAVSSRVKVTRSGRQNLFTCCEPSPSLFLFSRDLGSSEVMIFYQYRQAKIVAVHLLYKMLPPPSSSVGQAQNVASTSSWFITTGKNKLLLLLRYCELLSHSPRL